MDIDVSVGQLRVDPKLPSRPEYRGIHELSRDIRERGLLTPLMVRPSRRAGMYDVVCGRRRLLAIQELGWETVRCSVREDLAGDDEAASLASLADTFLRQEPGKLETAWNLAHLKKVSGADAKQLARFSRLSPATVRRYCAVGSTVTPDALREAGVALDEAVRMPIRALDRIARTEDDGERRQKLRTAAEARRSRRSVLYAVAPELDPSLRPYQLRQTRTGGLSLTVRKPADEWPAEVAESFVREFAESALPMVRTAWEQSGSTWPGDLPDGSAPDPGSDEERRRIFEAGQKAGMDTMLAAARETVRREVQKVQEQLDQANARLREAQAVAPGEAIRIEKEIRVRLEQSAEEHRKELSSLKLRYELTLAQMRQQAESAREEVIRSVVELQRDVAEAKQQRKKDEAEIAALREELARSKRGGGLKGLLFGS